MGGKIEKDSFGYCHRDIGPFVLDFRQCGYQKGRRVTAAGVGMHQPKKAVYQKRLRTICGARSKMSGAC
jgi:hypothetical protein